MSFNMYDAIHQSRKAAFTLLYELNITNRVFLTL